MTACKSHSGGLANGQALDLAGERPDAAFGTSGDLVNVNSDHSFADVVIGAPGDSFQDSRSGTVYIYEGSAKGPTSTVAARLIGGLNDQFGVSVAGIGAISASNEALAIASVGASRVGSSSRAAVFVFYGLSGGLLRSGDEAKIGIRFSDTADIIIQDDASGTNAKGLVVSSAGDIDQNGALDLAIANPAANVVYLFLNGSSFPNSTRLLTSQADVTITGASDDLEFGSSIAAVGDVNGQNQGLKSWFGDDLLIGSPGSAGGKGRAYLILGRQSFPRGHISISSVASQTYEGNGVGDRLGTSVAGLGDFDADGFGDVAVGAPGNLAGYVNIYFGVSITGPPTQNPMVIVGEGMGDGFGTSLAGALPFGVNGAFPLFVGASGSAFAGAGAGSAYGFTKALFASGSSLRGVKGSASFADNLIRSPFGGYGAQGRFGGVVRAGRDVNGDSSGDLLIGSPGASSAGQGSGAALVLW